jgi:hypothetical protein
MIKRSVGRPKDTNNRLVIGDLHLPFVRKGYLEFVQGVQEEFKCKHVTLIGDVIDNHYSSYHEQDPDGYSAGEELDRAVDMCQEWYKAFPKAEVCLGNHDAIIQRKAYSSGLSSKWIKGYSDVLRTPGWKWDIEFIHDGVLYTHGTGTSGQMAAYNRALHRRLSTWQGHLHTEAYVRHGVSNNDKFFGAQTGCGVDDTAYAMAYGRNFMKKSIIACGVTTNNGNRAHSILMDL